MLSPLLAFVAIYVATLAAGVTLFGSDRGFARLQWIALAAVCVATVATRRLFHDPTPAGFSARPARAAKHFAAGALLASLIVAVADLLAVATGDVARSWSGAVDPLELVAIFVPAAVHEELLFRGYPFQTLARWGGSAAVAISSVLFAVLHAGNDAVSAVALANIALAGVLLALAVLAAAGSLWFPIGIHLAWNVASGPVLGHEVSGYQPRSTLFIIRDGGPVIVTGGEFGIEASIWMTVVEVAAIVYLVRRLRNARRADDVLESVRPLASPPAHDLEKESS